jgi:hypothetical protein
VLFAVHSHCAAALTLNAPEAPSLPNEALAGEISIAQGAASWWRDTDSPAIVNAPVRSEASELAATLTLTVPLPVPFAPLPIVIHGLSDVTVHVHWLVVATVTEPAPPAAPNASEDADSV